MSERANRFLTVTIYDKHDSAAKRRRGSNVDRTCVVDDSGRESPVLFPDQDSGDLLFSSRIEQCFVNYLNVLGREGWEVVTHSPWQSTATSVRFLQEGFSHFRDVPITGTYLLTKVN